MTTTTQKRQHGGPRPGAGRKPLGAEPMVQIKLALPPDAIAWLDRKAAGRPRSEVARSLILRAIY